MPGKKSSNRPGAKLELEQSAKFRVAFVTTFPHQYLRPRPFETSSRKEDIGRSGSAFALTLRSTYEDLGPQLAVNHAYSRRKWT